MITRSKVGVFKPKSFTINTVMHSSIPATIKEELHSPNWFRAMIEEYDLLIHNKIWVLTCLPSGSKVADCRWIFKKYNVDDSFQRHKARFVAKGFIVRDYNETYSSFIKPSTICIVL